MTISTKMELELILNERGGATSLRTASGKELLVLGHESVPTFAIQLVETTGEFSFVTSDEAGEVEELGGEDDTRTFRFTDVGRQGITVTTRVRITPETGASFWTLSLEQPEGVRIADVHFPYLVVPNRYEGQEGTKLVVPFREGRLIDSPKPGDFEVDHPTSWRFEEKRYAFDYYPGTTFAQFLAYYTKDRGLYVACEDPSGALKDMKPVDRAGGVRLGIAHVVGWDTPGHHSLGYEVQVSAFEGDWTTAADRYRSWYESTFRPTKLAARNDVPSWLLDSPLHVILRAQGELDHDPGLPNPEVVPATNALQYLDEIAEAVGADVLPVMMAWEGPGPWVYPESFPVAGGDAAMRAFSRGLRERGWHLGTYCNGTQWVTEHKWTGYSGASFYRENGGEDAVCRTPREEPWKNKWDQDWRTSYTSCVATPGTRTLAKEFVAHLLDLGFDWIQFLDQNCGAAAFPCYSAEHGHPSAPGHWMSQAMDRLLDDFDELVGERVRDVAFSVESAPNDYALGRFAICCIRPNLHSSSNAIPLYKYLYHEYILTEAAFAPGPNPYWMQIKTAVSFVEGDMITAIMGRAGQLVNWSGDPWARWDEPSGDQQAILDFLRRAVAMRTDVARDFLVFGQLLGIEALEEVETVAWIEGARAETKDAVLSARWRSQDGREAVALANWTTELRTAQLRVAEAPSAVHGCNVDATTDSGSVTVTLPGLSTGLVVFG